MPRITRAVAAVDASSSSIVDTVILDLKQRQMQRGTFVGASGIRYDVELPQPVLLRMGDLLMLDDGTFVEVVAEAEPLIEVRAKDIDALARVAWRLGDRHVPVEILPNRLRLRGAAAIEKMLAELGAKVIPIEAPFNPEGGAYVVTPSSGRHHYHHNDHEGDHGHHHHDGHHHDHHREGDH
jgi:urease accessory protein